MYLFKLSTNPLEDFYEVERGRFDSALIAIEHNGDPDYICVDDHIQVAHTEGDIVIVDVPRYYEAAALWADEYGCTVYNSLAEYYESEG